MVPLDDRLACSGCCGSLRCADITINAGTHRRRDTRRVLGQARAREVFRHRPGRRKGWWRPALLSAVRSSFHLGLERRPAVCGDENNGLASVPPSWRRSPGSWTCGWRVLILPFHSDLPLKALETLNQRFRCWVPLPCLLFAAKHFVDRTVMKSGHDLQPPRPISMEARSFLKAQGTATCCSRSEEGPGGHQRLHESGEQRLSANGAVRPGASALRWCGAPTAKLPRCA